MYESFASSAFASASTVERNVRSSVAKLPAFVIARRAWLAIPASSSSSRDRDRRLRDDGQRREALVERDERDRVNRARRLGGDGPPISAASSGDVTNGAPRGENRATRSAGQHSPLELRVGGVADRAPADEPAVVRRQPDRAAARAHDARGAAHDLLQDAVEVRHRRELARQLEQRLGALRLAPLRLVEARVDERDRDVAREHLEQAQVVGVELVEPELRDDDDADDGRAVAERDREQRLLDLGRPGDADADPAVRRVAGQERLARQRDVAGDTLADTRLQHVHRRSRRGQVAAERDRAEVVAVADEHAAVVVVDQKPELVGDRRADLRDVVQAAELRRDAVEHLEVRDRAELRAPRVDGCRGPLAAALLEDDDLPLPPRLRGHHRDLGAGDELTRVRRVLRPGARSRPRGSPGRPGRTPRTRSAPGRARRAGSASASPLVGAMIANSSPPIRHTQSDVRTAAHQHPATSERTWSPVAWL